jgi:hypothetical protein
MARRWLRVGIPLAGAAVLITAIAGPAAAQNSDDTTFTLNLQTGTLTIAVTNAAVTMTPNPVAPGQTATGSFGSTVVTDERAAAGAGAAWTATVGFPQGADCPRNPTTCSFINSATPAATIPNTAVSYTSNTATTTGTGTFTAGGTFTLNPSGTAYSHGTDGGGNNTATWTPDLSVAVPAAATDSSPYTAIVRHSVA